MTNTGDTAEPMYELAHLGHAELLTPAYDESLRFFVNIYGLDLVHEAGGSAYLRAWGDHDLTTLKLTASQRAGLGHVGWRTVSPQALDRRVAALEARGPAGEWISGDFGHGRAYSFSAPSGQRMELYFEAEKYRAPAGGGPTCPTSHNRRSPGGRARRGSITSMCWRTTSPRPASSCARRWVSSCAST